MKCFRAGPYPSYKPVPVDWLGDVPEHWDTKPLKRWVSLNTEVLPETTAPEHEFRYLDIGSVGTGILTQQPQMIRFGAAPSRARRVVHKGDTIVSTVRTYLKAVYFIREADDELICSTGFAVLTPSVQALPEFVSYVAQSNAFTDCVMAESIGVAYPAIAESRLGSLHVPIPPLDEQEAIIRLIRHIDQRVNRLIKAKRRLIELLNEQKQAIIQRAVTRGLDPNARRQSAGVEWLGEIPSHWQSLRSRYLFREFDVRSKNGEEEHLSMTQDRGLIPSDELSSRRLVSESYAGGKLCQAGDLVLNRLKAHLGVFALAPMQGVLSPDYTVFRPICTMNPSFFELVYRTPACRVELRRRTKGIVQGFWRLYTDDFYDIRVPVPPVQEQNEILRHLNVELSTLNNALSRAVVGTQLLREYRTRLVADVVTGQLDVRHLSIPDAGEQLLDIAPELEDEDLEDSEEELAEVEA